MIHIFVQEVGQLIRFDQNMAENSVVELIALRFTQQVRRTAPSKLSYPMTRKAVRKGGSA